MQLHPGEVQAETGVNARAKRPVANDLAVDCDRHGIVIELFVPANHRQWADDFFPLPQRLATQFGLLGDHPGQVDE